MNDASAKQSGKRLVLILVCFSTWMCTVDAGILNVAMPTLTAAFRTTVAVSQWFVLSYLLSTTILLLTFGRLGDMLGRRRLYISGVIVFTAGSVLCGCSASAMMLILSRAIQGIGASVIQASGPALITEASPANERGRSLGFIGTAVAAGLLAGPLVGGLLIQYASWRWMFFINVPIGVALALLMATRVHGYDQSRDGRMDIPGAVLMALTLSSLLLGLTFGGRFGWISPRTILLLGSAIVLGAGFILVELRSASPMVPLGLFRNRELSIGAAAGWTNYAAAMPLAIYLPFYLENLLGYQPRTMGLILACGPLTLAFVAPIAGTLSDRIGPRVLTFSGLMISALALLSMQSLGLNSTTFDIVWRLVLMNFGAAIFTSPNSSSVMGSVPKENLGTASGVVALIRNLGMVCGIALAGATIASVTRGSSKDLAFLAGLKAVLFTSAGLCAVGSALSAMRVRPTN